MLAQQVAKKYSRALLEITKDKNLLDTAWDQLGSLLEYLKKDKTFLNFMAAPQVSDQKKAALVEKAFVDKLERPFYDFILVLVKKRRINFLPQIIEEFDRLCRAEKGIAKATCITATPLTDDERREVIERLAQKTSLKIELEEKRDELVIGGMIVMLRGQIMDGSIRYGLDQLRNRLMKVRVH